MVEFHKSNLPEQLQSQKKIYLHQFHLFAGLQHDEIDRILRITTVEIFKLNEIIYRPLGTYNRLYLVHHGKIKLFLPTRQGSERIFQILCPGDIFGGVLLRTATDKRPWAQALDDAVVSSMDETEFRYLILEFSRLSLNFFRYVTERHTAELYRLNMMIHMKVAHRLVLTLLDLGDRFGHGGEEHFELDPPLTHQDLANMIGAARQTVSDTINQLRESGVLGGEGQHCIIHRPAAEQFLQQEVGI